MENNDDLILYKHIKVLTDIIRSLGVVLKIGSDFAELWNAPKHQPSRHPVNPAFNPNYCDLDASNAFWIMGYGREGELVHTQAVKLLDLNGGTLFEHFENRIWDFRTHGYDFDADKTQMFLSPEASRINGCVTYHGEVWMKPGGGGYRGGSLVVLLTRLLLMRCLLKWSPDFLIGLQAPMTTCRGLGIREGYMRTEQRTLVWYEKGAAEPMEDWMVWMSREDAQFNLRVPPEFFYNMFKKNAEPAYPVVQKMSA